MTWRNAYVDERPLLFSHLTNTQIRDARPELCNRRLRLIQSGRLLTNGTYLYSWLEALEERQQRAIVTEEDNVQHPAKSSTTWVHCSVGPAVEPGNDDSDEGKQVLHRRFLSPANINCCKRLCNFSLHEGSIDLRRLGSPRRTLPIFVDNFITNPLRTTSILNLRLKKSV